MCIRDRGLIIQWVEEKGASHELLLEYPASPGLDDSRQLLANGLDQFSGIDSQDGMIHLKLKDGSFPVADSSITEVLIDEGTSQFLEWKVGDQPTIAFGTMTEQVEIVGITKGELFRTVYFHRSDLAESVGLNVTSVLIDLPEGATFDIVSPQGNIESVIENIKFQVDLVAQNNHLYVQFAQDGGAVSYTHLTLPTKA